MNNRGEFTQPENYEEGVFFGLLINRFDKAKVVCFETAIGGHPSWFLPSFLRRQRYEVTIRRILRRGRTYGRLTQAGRYHLGCEVGQ